MLKRLVKQRKHYLSLARKSFKNQENISENERLEISFKNGSLAAQMGGLESPQFILRHFKDNFSHNIPYTCILSMP